MIDVAIEVIQKIEERDIPIDDKTQTMRGKGIESKVCLLLTASANTTAATETYVTCNADVD